MMGKLTWKEKQSKSLALKWIKVLGSLEATSGQMLSTSPGKAESAGLMSCGQDTLLFQGHLGATGVQSYC